MRLTYHQQIMEMLGSSPEICPERVARLRHREAELGIKIPESVFEFFSLKNAENVFLKNSNNDFLIDLSEIGKNLEPSQTKNDWLCVASENQGVFYFMVKLDQADPEVWQTNDSWPIYDSNDLPISDYSNLNWGLCSESFSSFIFDLLTFSAFCDGMALDRFDAVGTGCAPTESQLESIVLALKAGPHSIRHRSSESFFNEDGMPSSIISELESPLKSLRFYGDNSCLKITNMPGGKSEYFIASGNEGDFVELFNLIKSIPEVVTGLQSEFKAYPLMFSKGKKRRASEIILGEPS